MHPRESTDDKHQNGPGLTRLPPVAKTWAGLRNAAENIYIYIVAPQLNKELK